MTNGTREKAKWCADNWATTARLGSRTVRTSDKRPVMMNAIILSYNNIIMIIILSDYIDTVIQVLRYYNEFFAQESTGWTTLSAEAKSWKFPSADSTVGARTTATLPKRRAWCANRLTRKSPKYTLRPRCRSLQKKSSKSTGSK